jgi:steroid delta-isomerase-like uncharacterized protein
MKKMSKEENERITRLYTEEIWGKGNLEAINEVFATNYIDRIPFPGYSPDRDGLKKSISEFRSAVPDLQVKVEDLITEGDKVVARWTSSGTQKGELMGIPPTNKKVSMVGITICRIENGKIVEEWSQADFAGLMQQLGAGAQSGKQ